MKNKIQYDREINSFIETLKELKQALDVRKTAAYDTIGCLLEILDRLKVQLKRDAFFSFVEQQLNITLEAYEKDYILGYKGENVLSKCDTVSRECLIGYLKLAYLGEEFVHSRGYILRVIKIPKRDTYEFNKILLPAELLCETMNKLYGNKWRYTII